MSKRLNRLAMACSLALGLTLAGAPVSAQNPPPYDCNKSEGHRDFDFWLGKWEVTDKAGETVYGHNRIEKAEKGCLLMEHWTSASGGSGTSMNYFNPVTREWHQDWVDAGASVIKTKGGLEKNSMSMKGKIYYMASGQRADFRGKWTPLEDGRVRQFFEQKNEKGEWFTWFDGYYRKVE